MFVPEIVAAPRPGKTKLTTSAGFATCTTTGLETLGSFVPFPKYHAVTECEPSANPVVVQLA